MAYKLEKKEKKKKKYYNGHHINKIFTYIKRSERIS